MSEQPDTEAARDTAAVDEANATREARAACEVMFYHLTRQPLEQVLPGLLHKTLQRGKRALVRCGNALRVKPLSDAVWTWREEAFIAHGTPEDGHLERQPVLIVPADFHPGADGGARGDASAGGSAPNGAHFLFCVEGADVREEDFATFERICVMFADMDAAGKEQARGLWRSLKEREDLHLTYWQQEPRGGWQRKA